MSEKILSDIILFFQNLNKLMILKQYQLSNINNIKSNYYLFYGENQGLKTEAIDIIKKSGFAENVYRYEEMKF